MAVFDDYRATLYDPVAMGPIYVIQVAQDCVALPGTLGVGPVLAIEQGGRRYIAGGTPGCGPSWATQTLVPNRFAATDFVLLDGPTCPAATACPDFSATGAPIALGFANLNQGSGSFAGASGGFGVDNWKVTV